MNPDISPDERLRRWLPELAAIWRSRHPARTREAGSGGLGAPELAAVARALHKLQRGLTGERSLSGSAYMDDADLFGAYLLYYWPVSYMQVSLVLEELGASLAPEPRCLDLGAGPGPMAAALVDIGATELTLTDTSQPALDVALELLRARAPTIRARAVSSQLCDLESDAALPPGPYDLVVFGHSLNELWQGLPDRHDRLLRLLRRASVLLSPEGVLLVIEPAALAVSRAALELRDALAAVGHEILGPCPGSYACPALAAGPQRTCHLDTPWSPPEPLRSLAREAGLDRQSVKCTWFALRRSDAPAAARREESRVVSDPMLNKAGRVRYFLCGQGSLTTVSADRRSGRARSLGFFALRRGDRVSLSGAETRVGGLGIAETTDLVVHRRAPRPDRAGGTP